MEMDLTPYTHVHIYIHTYIEKYKRISDFLEVTAAQLMNTSFKDQKNK